MIGDQYLHHILDNIDPTNLDSRYIISALVTDDDGIEIVLTDEELDDLPFYQSSPLFPSIQVMLDIPQIRRDIEQSLMELYEAIYGVED